LLVALAVTASAHAQFTWRNADFPRTSALSAVDWQGAPALFVAFRPEWSKVWEFVRFRHVPQGAPEVELELIGAGFLDSRACAQGSVPVLAYHGDVPRWYFSPILGAMTLEAPARAPTLAYYRDGLSAHTPWSLSYCDALCYSRCDPMEAAPELVGFLFRVRAR
jgi:hypothetical protein